MTGGLHADESNSIDGAAHTCCWHAIPAILPIYFCKGTQRGHSREWPNTPRASAHSDAFIQNPARLLESLHGGVICRGRSATRQLCTRASPSEAFKEGEFLLRLKRRPRADPTDKRFVDSLTHNSVVGKAFGGAGDSSRMSICLELTETNKQKKTQQLTQLPPRADTWRPLTNAARAGWTCNN